MLEGDKNRADLGDQKYEDCKFKRGGQGRHRQARYS